MVAEFLAAVGGDNGPSRVPPATTPLLGHGPVPKKVLSHSITDLLLKALQHFRNLDHEQRSLEVGAAFPDSPDS